MMPFKNMGGQKSYLTVHGFCNAPRAKNDAMIIWQSIPTSLDILVLEISTQCNMICYN